MILPVGKLQINKVRDTLSGRGHLILLFLISIWITFIGVGLWGYASIENEPPLFDALSYMEKAKSFWAAVDGGMLFNPLSVEPTIRPFGTVLMSYPFGYTEDFRGFYFRSLFIPIILFAVAVICTVSVKRLSSAQLLVLFSMAVALTAAPANYQLQFNEDVYSFLGTWGLVDTFFSAILGIAAAFAIRKSENDLVKNALICSIVASFSILVKPAGLMLMAVVGMVWLIIHGSLDPRHWLKDAEFRKAIIVFVCVYGVTLLSVIGSEYFSLEHTRYGLGGMKMLQYEVSGFPTLYEVLDKFRVSIGVFLSVVLVVGMLISIQKKYRRYFFAIAFVLLSGFWLWLIKTNINHARYFLPFQVIAIILVVPPMLSVVESWSRKFVVLFSFFLLFPAFVIGYVFSSEHQNMSLQRFAGINLSTNFHEVEVKQAQNFQNELIKNESKANIIYYVGNVETNTRIRAFLSVMEFDRVVGGSKANTIPALPIDYVREHAYRLDEILFSKYIVFDAVDDPSKILAENKDVDSFALEELIISAWLTLLDDSNGVSMYSSDSLRVLQVTDRFALSKSAVDLYNSFNWREPFLKGFTQPDWVKQSDIDLLPNNLVRDDVDLYLDNKLMASIVGAVLSHGKNEIILSIYIRQHTSLLSVNDTDPWFVFVHLLGADKELKKALQVSFVDNTLKPGAVGVYKIRFSADKLSDVTGFATGIYSPKGSVDGFMLSEGGDWNGMRTIMNCPELCSSWKK